MSKAIEGEALVELRGLLTAVDRARLGELRAETQRGYGGGPGVNVVTYGHPTDDRERWDLFEDPPLELCQLTAAALRALPALLAEAATAAAEREALRAELAAVRSTASSVAETLDSLADERNWRHGYEGDHWCPGKTGARNIASDAEDWRDELRAALAERQPGGAVADAALDHVFKSEPYHEGSRRCSTVATCRCGWRGKPQSTGIEALSEWRAHCELAAPDAAPAGGALEAPVCANCGGAASCYGSYEGHPEGFACDACCGHGNEDGWCEQ